MADEQTRRAWAYLSRVTEPPCPALTEYVGVHGPVEAAARIRSGTEPPSLTDAVAGRRDIDRSADDLAMLDRRGGRLITPDDDEWPYLSFAAFGAEDVRRKQDGRVPMVLWAIGPARLDDIADRAAAIVGTRAATAYGEHMAATLADGLVEHDVAVVSGGAYGIDGAAHRAALAAEGCTVAVLAGGIDVPYPSGHSALLHRISQTGLLLTEYPPGVRPARFRFLARNRLVAALGRATVVVEAGLRSGAANTASWAAAMGRVVCAVPGPVTSSASAGCHVLLRGTALLVDRPDELVEIVGKAGEFADEPQHPVAALDGLSRPERLVYEALPARGYRSLEEIAVDAALPAESVLGPLALLEVSGLVQRKEGRWRIVSRSTPA
jgi:DNA processing protein